jgi:hypothetical protein
MKRLKFIYINNLKCIYTKKELYKQWNIEKWQIMNFAEISGHTKKQKAEICYENA